MYRLLLIAVLLIVMYLLLRKAFRDWRGGTATGMAVGKNQMIQDPVCRVYVPRGSAVAESIGGQTYYFCSTACAKTFQKQLTG